MFCSKKKLRPLCPHILTPDRIPPFFIPAKLPPRPNRGELLGKTSGTAMRALWGPAGKDTGRALGGQEQKGEASEEGYLLESPHVHCGESLFHQMGPSGGSCQLKPLPLLDLSRKCSSHDFPFLFGTIHGDAPPPVFTMYSSSMLNHSLTGIIASQHLNKHQTHFNALFIKTLSRSNSSEETCSEDTDPTLLEHPKCRVSMVHLIPPPIFHLDFICCQDQLAKETAIALSQGGLVRLSVEYMKDLRRLYIKLVTAENLYPVLQDPKAISCCVVMCLMPGKHQKQRSTVIRRSRNPIFNEDFIFEGLERLELERLRVKAINQGSGLKGDNALGRGEIQLSTVLPVK